MTFNPAVEWTGGGLVNNPQDLVRWGRTLYEGRAMDSDYLDELLEPGFVQDADRPLEGYGRGVGIGDSGGYGLVYGHGGFFPGYNSRLAYFPDYGVAVAMQINSDKSEVDSHTMALAGNVLDALSAKEASDGH